MAGVGVAGVGVAGVGVAGVGVASVGVAGVGVALTLEIPACRGWRAQAETVLYPACPGTWPLQPPSEGEDHQRAGEHQVDTHMPTQRTGEY